MPKDIIGILGVVMFSLFFITTSLTVATEDTRHTELLGALNETAEVTALETFDYSSRVDRGIAFFDTDLFESTFKDNFNLDNNIKLGDHDFDFEYLYENVDGHDQDSVKAIRITLTDERGTEFVATLATDIRKDTP